MQEQQENIHPNTGSPGLADVIRENINYQLDQSIKRTLLKESILKISLDKDFQHLFETYNNCSNLQAQAVTLANSQNASQKQPYYLQVAEEIKEVCQWLEESQQFCGIAHLPFNMMPRLVHILHQKIQNTAIVVTQYPTYWVNKMEEMGRLSKLKWGILSAGQEAEDKVRVLQLYQLKKLKILFITPSLFKCEEYHQFQCDLLIVGDMHLYHNQSPFLSKIISKTNPSRVLTIYHTLIAQHYTHLVTSNRMVQVNKPRTSNFNFIVLRTNFQDKFKNMMTYLAKNQFKRILIVVNKRQEAYALNKKLLLQSKTSINLFDYLSGQEMNSFVAEDMLDRTEREKEEEKVFELMRRVNSCEITISKNTDFLRFCNFDLTIYYSFTDVLRFVQSCFTTKQKLLLFSEDDYHNSRNLITADLTTLDCLQKLVMRMVQKPLRKEEPTKKRCYSECVQDKLLDCYTISKQYAQKDEQKVIRINSFCRKYEITSKLFNKVMEALERNNVVAVSYRTIYEIQIDMDSISRLKKQLPQIEQIRRKINLLNVSTSLHKTIRCILEQLKKQGIKYKITEQAMQIKILKNYQDIDWETVNRTVNAPVLADALTFDKSLQTFRDCAYSSIQLTKRQKALQKKQIMLNFLNGESKQNNGGLMESFHKSNLLLSQIEQWIRHSDEVSINEHDLVLLLQGVQRGRITRFKDDPIYGRYRKLRYEQLMQAVTRIYSNKKVKQQ